MDITILFLFGQDQNIPFHPEIITGKLENGLTYYVLQNDKPDNRAELRLAINIGSVDEDDDQCMTKKLHRRQLIKFLSYHMI